MRQCCICDSIETLITRRGYPQWHTKNNQYYCHKCYEKYIHGPVYAPIRNSKHNPRLLKFKNKRILLKTEPRLGICQLCGAIAGINCKMTVIHHIQYHDDNPLKDTIELCPKCHIKQHPISRWK